MACAKTIWLLGGDRRQAELARLLAMDGHTVHTWALEEGLPAEEPGCARQPPGGLSQADCVILPLPAADGTALHSPLSQFHPSLRQVFDALAPGQLVLAGMADPGLKALAQERGVLLLDYFAREELAVANAVPTAEGAIQIAMEQLPITLHGAQVLVLGFGRIGQATALRLATLGTEVTVAARRWEALAWAKAVGCKGVLLSQLAESPCPFHLVVNTIPALVLGREVLKALPAGCLILDLASKPGGVDRTAAQELGLPVIHALSLPGKVAPVTAAAILQTTIYHMLQELEQPGKEDAT